MKITIDKSTCWYNENLHREMNKYTKQEPSLDMVKHGIVLKNLFSSIPEEYDTVIDLGCGNAKASTVIGDRYYVGVDLPNNVEKIGKINNPDLEFIKCDIITDDIGFIRHYKIVLMNAFIDVMQYPIEILNKVLKNCHSYIVLHRQEIIEGNTYVKMNPSYGGVTYHSLINRDEFLNLISSYNFEIEKEADAGFGGNWRSFILAWR